MSEGFTVEDAGGTDEPKEPKKRRRDERSLLLTHIETWRSPGGIAHATWPHEKHMEHGRIYGTAFRSYLQAAYYRSTGAGLSGTAVGELVDCAAAAALVGGEVRQPWRRVALHRGCVILDLGGGNPGGERRAVEISAHGWRLLAAPDVPVPFIRGGDALPMPAPEPDGARCEDLGALLNVENPDELALGWAWLVCALRPFDAGGSYPIVLLHGEQGSGKTHASRALQDLVDPSTLSGRSLPREPRDLWVSAANRHLLAFDNLSHVGDLFADDLCRIATGGGFAARQLHSDSDEVIIDATRPLLLNGIPQTLLSRPDLADRAISLELRPLAERREEAQLKSEFERMRPGLLGLICDGLAAALRNLPATKVENPPRMIDAVCWAEAAAPGLGIPPGHIAAAWRANRGAADRAAIEVDDVAQAVVKLLDESPSGQWKGAPGDLYSQLCALVPERVTRSPLWPKNAAGLGSKLRRLAPGLRAVHRIEVVNGKGGADGSRWSSIRRL